MDTYNDDDDELSDDNLDAQRETIRSHLSEIAADIGMVMRDAGLNFPVSDRPR